MSSPATEKHCRECGEIKPLSNFFYRTRDGYAPDCKPCYQAKVKAKRIAKGGPTRPDNPVVTAEDGTQTKKCSGVCGQVKPVAEFGVDTRYNDGKLVAHCRACKKLELQKHYQQVSAGHLKNRADEQGSSSQPSPVLTAKSLERKKKGGNKPEHDVQVDILGVASKQCCRCDEVLPLTEFYVDIGKLTGRKAECKACFNQSNTTSKAKQLRYNLNMAIGMALRSKLSKAVIRNRAPAHFKDMFGKHFRLLNKSNFFEKFGQQL